MTNLAIEVKNFSKHYGDFTAVDNISFDVRRGEVFGLLGPNGAGKTTTMECVEGLRRPDAGELKVMGLDVTQNTRLLHDAIGVQLQTGSLPGYLSVGESLRLFSAYHGVEPDFTLLERMGLADKTNAQYQTLSTGQKRRVALALAVVHRPLVLFLDEPTAGLDVSSRKMLHQLMDELKQEGMTIILSTHDMAEAETMSDRVAILLGGRLVAQGTPKELTSTGEGLTRVSVRSVHHSLADIALPGAVRHTLEGDYSVYLTAAPGPSVTALMSHMEKTGDELIDLRVERPSLEERFLELTQKSA